MIPFNILTSIIGLPYTIRSSQTYYYISDHSPHIPTDPISPPGSLTIIFGGKSIFR